MFGWKRECEECKRLEEHTALQDESINRLREFISTERSARLKAEAEFAALRNEGTYTAYVYCSNCAHRWDGRFKTGLKIEEAGLECPNCGCLTVHKAEKPKPKPVDCGLLGSAVNSYPIGAYVAGFIR